MEENQRRTFNGRTIEDMLNTHTKEEWAKIINEECEVLGLELVSKEENKYFCKSNDLEDGDVLYLPSSWDGGLEFTRIYIKYCPVCGKRLPNTDED